MTLPYTFATATGNIPLSELDANFASVQAYVFTAGTVVANAQPNITSVGTLSNLTISALTTTDDIDVTGQLTINWLTGNGTPSPGPGILANTANIYDIGQSGTQFRSGYFSGTVYAGNIINSGSSSVTGNVTGNNLLAVNTVYANVVTANTVTTNGIISGTGNIIGNYFLGNGSQLTGIAATYGNANVANYLPTFSGNLTAGNISITGNIINAGSSSSIGNITGGNLITAGTLKNTGLENVEPDYIVVSANAQTVNLSSTTSTNFLTANNTGYTCTVNLPSSPVEGQITRFTVVGNTLTIIAGTGNTTSSFAGSITAGTGFKYIYRVSANAWFKSV